MKQFALFKNDEPEDNKYSKKVDSPVYEPKNTKPHLLSLYDDSKTHRLIREIIASSLTVEEKEFLITSARRHTVFNYERIADYYAHSSSEMQDLMEKSALVIIDFNNAIRYGYVVLCDTIKKQYLTEYPSDQEMLNEKGVISDSELKELEEKQEIFDFNEDNIESNELV
jgi:hypothetical protein